MIGGLILKRLLSIIVATILATSMSLSAFAAVAIPLGTDDFPQNVDAKGTVVSKTVKFKNSNSADHRKLYNAGHYADGAYQITGINYSAPAKKVLPYINAARKEKGLAPLEWMPELVQPAIQRALEQYLIDNSPYLSHTRPDGSEWVTVSKYANGENLAGGAQYDAETVSLGWIDSPDHYDNIIEPKFTATAVACVETDKTVYWVQLFHQGKAGEESSDNNEEETTPPDENTVTSESIVAALGKAKSGQVASVSLKAVDSLPIAALKSAASWGTKNKKSVSITVSTLTSTGKSTQGQLTINPAGFTKNKTAIKTGVRVDKATVADVAAAFSKANPKAKFAVIKLDQTGSFGGTVTVGAKADVSKMKTTALNFYYFNPENGIANKINLGKNGYSIDNNKYLRFQTTKGGYIVVTDTVLAKV